ncbi:hypothetical protein AM593_10527, partial [Mytilus galloprovincialis]
LNYITTADKEGKHFGDLLLDLVKKYGHTIKLILISKPLVVSVNQEAVKELLVTGGHKKSDDIYKRASKTSYDFHITVNDYSYDPLQNSELDFKS